MTKPISPQMMELSRRLIALEKGLKKPSGDLIAYNFAAVDRLRSPLVILMSRVGYHALLLRAQVLASRNVPWLTELTIHSDGTLSTGSKEAGHAASRNRGAMPSPEAVHAGSLLFLAQVLMLLEAFIGEVLTLHLASEVWPEVPLDNLDSDRGELLEKAT